jgi:hypothetical protein
MSARYGGGMKQTPVFSGATRIEQEWLYRAKSTKEALLFERTGDQVERGHSFFEGAALLNRGRLRRTESLFLSLAAQIGAPTATSIMNYMIHNVRTISGVEDQTLRDFTETCLESGRFRESILGLLQGTGTGIVDIRLADEDEMPTVTEKDYPKDQLQMVQRQIIQTMRIQTIHPIFDAVGEQTTSIYFPMPIFESQGTQKLFALSGPIFDALATGRILIIDEIDAKFHPLMTKAIVNLFQSATMNPKHAQLIFITHDTNLLDRRNLRRDQIWFVEKDRLGASHLYSLAEFKGLRKQGSTFQEDYIAGRFGAIPFMGDLSRLIDNEEVDEASIAKTETGKK